MFDSYMKLEMDKTEIEFPVGGLRGIRLKE